MVSVGALLGHVVGTLRAGRAGRDGAPAVATPTQPVASLRRRRGGG